MRCYLCDARVEVMFPILVNVSKARVVPITAYVCKTCFKSKLEASE